MNLFIQDKTEPFSMPYLNFSKLILKMSAASVKTADYHNSANTPSKHRSMEQLLKSPHVQELLRDSLKAVTKKNGTPKHSTQIRYHPESSDSPLSKQIFPRIDRGGNIHLMQQLRHLKKKKVSTVKRSSNHHKKYQYQNGRFMQFHLPFENVTTLNISSKPIHVVCKAERSKNQESFLNNSMDAKQEILQSIKKQHQMIQSEKQMEKMTTQQEEIVKPIKPAPRQNSQLIKTSRNRMEPLQTPQIALPKKKEKKKVRRFDGIFYIDPKFPQDPIFQNKYASMRHYFNILNLSNYLFVQPSLNIYKAYIGKGNNGMLVRQVLKNRWWWTILDEQEPCHFVWTQLKVNQIHESMKQMIRPQNESFSSQSASSTLTTLGSFGFGQREDQSSDNELQDPRKTLWGRFLSMNDIRQFGAVFNAIGREARLLTLEQAQSIRSKISVITESPRIHNHLENNFHLGNKKALFYNMRAYYESQNQNVFDNLPLTFHIKSPDSAEIKQFLDAYQSRQALMQRIENDSEPKKIKNIWIIKPGEITNRGNGIKVSEDLNEIMQILNSKELHKNGLYKTYIVQLYIDRPLLYNKRKFDIRCYSLYASINGYHKGYWYTEGYIRTSSKEFSIKNLTNKMVHLTNDAVQKKGEDYGRFERGNKVSFEEFAQYVENLGGDFTKIYARMKQMATEQFKAVYGKIDPNKRENTFEIFGLDFMIDDSFNVFMIEANTNPSIEICCPLLSKLIPQMLDNAFKIVLDPVYPPPNFYNPKKIICDNYLDNKFELVFDESTDGPSLTTSTTNNYDIGLIEEESEEEEPE